MNPPVETSRAAAAAPRRYRAKAPIKLVPFFIVFSAAASVISIWSSIGSRQPGSNLWIPIVTLLLVVGVVALTLMVRLYRASVTTDPRGITVRNVGRTYRFGWDEIDDFSVGETGYHSCIGLLHRRAGDPLPLHGVRGARGWLLDQSAEATALVEQLNEDRSRWGARAGPESS